MTGFELGALWLPSLSQGKEYGHIGEGFPTWTWGSRETFPEQRMSPLNSNESKNVLKCGLPGTSSKDSISVHEGGVNDYSVLRHREPGSAISRLDEVFFWVFFVCVCVFFFFFLLVSFFRLFWGCGPFLKFLLNLLQYCFSFMFWIFGHEACEILDP